jgi:tRNA A-37 threonylcarbamoyl transferase component Bud32
MAPDTRAQDLRRLEDSLVSANKEQATKYEQVTKLLEGYGQKLNSHKAKFGDINDLISGLTFQ